MIFSNNENTKLILTSRTYIWQPECYTCLSLSAYTCDLLSDEISLLLTERWGICHSYLNPVDIKTLKEETILMYSFFPSLCSSYTSLQNIPVEDFFTAPYPIIEKEIDNFKTKSQVSFIALAILAIKQTISKNSFSIDNHEYDDLFQDVFHESAFLQYPSKNSLKSTLVALTGTYVRETKDKFMLTHETLQKIVLRCIAKTLMKSVIKYCETEVILNQFRLDCIYEKRDAFIIEVTAENEDAYFRRLVYELGKGWNKSIFEHEQNKFCEFRLKFLKYMKKYLTRDTWDIMQDGLTHLHIVSDLGYENYVSFFLKDNAMINQKDSDGNIPLHLACRKGHNKIVKYLVVKKSIIDMANKEGSKPFVYACENNAMQVAKYLLHHSAKSINVNEKYQTKNNGTVLHIVSAKGFTNLVLLLLEKKADVDALDRSGCTPLHYASNSAVAKSLLDMNANINAIDSLGRSPVYLACGTKNERVLQLLIEKNAEINQKTINGLRPIHAACQSGSIGIVKILLEKGTTVNSSKPSIVPLHEACKIGNESITNILIAAKASVNHKTKDGLTPLHQACMNERVIVAKILLDNKANVNDANKYGWTALLFSCARGFHTVVDLLLQHGANVNICDEDKISPLMVACKENKTGVVDILLRSKANVNHCDKDNCSSLAFACKTGNVDLVELLLTYGADINLADKNMITPLHTACMFHHSNVVLILIEHKANVNAQDNLRQTPLFKSSINGYIDILDILLEHGASVDICDNLGKSPLAIAEIKGHKAIVDEIKQYRPFNQIV
ncbi:ankyrin-1-like [Mytilus californianus]|uniref:ankyrin-1-like n=1 Tax=Mytilus californianus TaxID=6549 RepID=UPI0022484C30|nr:ankyrin-1-like [Mytilus californianus]